MKYNIPTSFLLALSIAHTTTSAQPKDFVKLADVDDVSYYRSTFPLVDTNRWFVFAKNKSGEVELMTLRVDPGNCKLVDSQYKYLVKNFHTHSSSTFHIKGDHESLLPLHEALCNSSAPSQGGGLMSSNRPLNTNSLPKDFVYVRQGNYHQITSTKSHGTAHSSIIPTLKAATDLCATNNKKIWVEGSNWTSSSGFLSLSYKSSVTFDCVTSGGSDYSSHYSEGDIHVIPGPFGLIGVLDSNGFIRRSNEAAFPSIAESYCKSKGQQLLASPTNSYGSSPYIGFNFYCID